MVILIYGIWGQNWLTGGEGLLVVDDLEGAVYKGFINYALSTSDSFMFVIPYAAAEVQNAEDLLKNFPSEFRNKKEIYAIWKEREKQSRIEADIFKNHCISFTEKFKPYMIKQRYSSDTQSTVWPSTEIMSSQQNAYSIEFYRTDPETLRYLLMPHNYFGWRYPYYPEDLSFFRKGRCWALSSSHEEYIEVYPSNEQEYHQLINMGINFYDNNFTPYDINKQFYESGI